MSIHIQAKRGEIAEVALLPGDPLRAEFIAKTFLSDVVRYNEVRNMFGFTGNYKGKRVSVQGTGMGVPSISIYAQELMAEYGVKTLMRVGTCGAISKELKVRDVILAMTSSTNANIYDILLDGINYAPCANFELLYTAYEQAKKRNLAVKVGNVFTEDLFYNDCAQHEKWAEYGIIALEMETAALYTLAAKFDCKALSLLTVSDHLITGEITTSEERQTTFAEMMEIALDTAALI